METQILLSPTDQIREQAAQAEKQNAADAGTGGLLKSGETIQGYAVQKLLSSKGGEAEIYLCTKDNQNYALKYFYNHSPDSEILTKLFSFSVKHPNIVSYIARGQYKERQFLILEYAEGGALDDKKPDGTYKYLPVSEDALLQILKEVISALQTCHENGIIHRDIKPGNLFYKNAESEISGSDILVGDFGIASDFEADQGMSKHLTKAGDAHTIGYAAPELFGGHKDTEIVIGKEVDYYALGITVWVLLSGKEPFVNENGHPFYESQITLDTLQGKIPDMLLSRAPELSKRMQTLIRGLLTHRHDKRWGCNEINRFLTGEEVEIFTEKARDLPPFEIAGQKYHDYKSVAEALLAHPKEAKSLVFEGELSKWLIRIDQDIEKKISDLADTYSANNQIDKGVILVAYALCPNLPFLLDRGEKITSLQDITSLLETNPNVLIPYLRGEKNGFYTYLEAIGLSTIAKKIWSIVKTVSKNSRMIPRITIALNGNAIKPFHDGVNNDLELREIEQLYNLPEYLQERVLLFIERRYGELPAWIENLTGKNLESWLWKLDNQSEKLTVWGKWKYFTLFLQGNDIQSGEWFEEKGKEGYKDPLGNVLLPPVWEAVGPFNISGKFIVQKNEKFGVVTPDGKTVIPFKYDNLDVFDEENGVYETTIGGEYRYITETAVLFKGEYLCVKAVSGSPFEVIYNYELTKLFSRDFRLIKEFDEEFKLAASSKKVFVWFTENGKICIGKGTGEVIKQTDYTGFSEQCYYNDLPLLRVNQNKLVGIADAEGNPKVPLQYENICGDECCFVRKGKKWGVIDLKTFTQIHSCEYSKVLELGSSYALEKDKMFYFFNDRHTGLCKIAKDGNAYSISKTTSIEDMRARIAALKNKQEPKKEEPKLIDGKPLLKALYIIGWEEEFDDQGYARFYINLNNVCCYDGQNFLSINLETLKIKKREIEKEDGEYLLDLYDGDELWAMIKSLKEQNETTEMNHLVNATWQHFYDNEEWETARRILFFIKQDNMEGLERSYDYYRAYMARTLAEEGNHEDAVKYYEEAIQLNPDKDDEKKNWYNWECGDTYYFLKDYEKALYHFEKSLELEPEDQWLFHRKGNSLYCLERYKESISCYAMAIEKEKKAVFYNNRGNAYKALGMQDKADADYKTAKKYE